jgi:hypothetical protein
MMVALTACGGGETLVRPTLIPTPIPPTPTPRSTPLPPVLDAPQIGDMERPIRLLFALPDDASTTNAREAANQLQRDLEDELELSFSVDLVSESEALAEVCSGLPVAAWISAFSYVAAQTECGAIPVLAETNGTAPRILVGTTVEIVGRKVITNLDQLQDQVFCRSQEQDYATNWVLPSLVLAANGLDPATDLGEIRDYVNDLAVGRALYEIECNAAALPPGEFDDWLDDLSWTLSTEQVPVTVETLEGVLVVIQPAGDVALPASTSNWDGYDENVIPYEVLVFSPNSALPVALRNEIVPVITRFFEDRNDGAQRLHTLLDATGIIEVDNKDFDKFRTLLNDAHWDMTFAR